MGQRQPQQTRQLPPNTALACGPERASGVVKVLLEHPWGDINPNKPGWLVWLEFSLVIYLICRYLVVNPLLTLMVNFFIIIIL